MQGSDYNFLLNRLKWPSCLVRERAASVIASMLLQPEFAEATSAALPEWIRNQSVETFAAYGLLPVLKAQLGGARLETDFLLNLRDAVRRPSLLAWLFFRDLHPNAEERSESWLAHSGDAPESFTEAQNFSSEVRYYLPHAYADWGEALVRGMRVPFLRQWEFELKCIGGNTRHSTDKGLKAWRVLDRERRGYFAADPPSAEICRSAFLRAIAWAVQKGGLPLEMAIERIAVSCPIDLELWKLTPSRRPVWWPRFSASASKIAVGDDELWPQVRALWEKQAQRIPFAAGDAVGAEWILAAGSGFAGTAGGAFHVEIYSGLQQSTGGDVPSDDEVVGLLSGEAKRLPYLRVDGSSPMYLKGTVPLVPSRTCGGQVADWRLLPLSCRLIPETFPRWQIWRFHHGPRTVPNWFSPKRTEVEVAENALLTRHQGKVVGRWLDWTDGITEYGTQQAPTRSGEMLLVNRNWFEAVAGHYRGQLVWGCRITAFAVNERQETVEQLTFCRTLGGSRLILE